MQIRFEGGTPRQRAWVNEAIGLCTYPLNDLSSLAITVNWSDQFPSGADIRHPYMVTTPQNDGSFLVTIATWADDASNPNNQGLPNPPGDIKDFYMQSFVHELGHVVIDSTFNPGGTDTDARVQTCCGLFWKPQVDSGPGRALGTPSDWAATGKDWPNMIREAAAEVFKCAFFSGRLLFSNRTLWHIDESNWPSFLELISVPGGLQPVTYFDDFSVDDLATNYQLFTPSGEPTLEAAIDAPNSRLVVSGGFGYLHVLKMPSDVYLEFGYTHTVKVLGLPVNPAFFGAPVDPWFGHGAAGSTEPDPPASAFPYWIRAQSDHVHSVQTVESWATDPALGGSPFQTRLVTAWEGDNSLPTIGIAAAGSNAPGFAVGGPGPVTGELILDYWRIDTVRELTEIKASAPYPFGDQKGYVKPGPAAQGIIRVG